MHIREIDSPELCQKHTEGQIYFFMKIQVMKPKVRHLIADKDLVIFLDRFSKVASSLDGPPLFPCHFFNFMDDEKIQLLANLGKYLTGHTFNMKNQLITYLS